MFLFVFVASHNLHLLYLSLHVSQVVLITSYLMNPCGEGIELAGK